MTKPVASVVLALTATIGSVVCIQPVSAASLSIFNTGVNASGLALSAPGVQDPHWTINGNPSLTAVDPNGGWAANQATGTQQSGWIGPDPSNVYVPTTGGTYTYLQSFSIPTGATGFSLTGEWVVDNEGKIYINDYEILSARYIDMPGINVPIQQYKSFTLDDPAKLLPGSVNTLKVVVTDYGVPTGFQARFQGSYTPAPAPGPLPIVGLAAALTTSQRLRRRIRCQKGKVQF